MHLAHPLDADERVNRSRRSELAIYFNLGLVAERRGETEAAESWFGRANRLRPSTAAQAKLRGTASERACSFVDRRGAIGQEYAGWAELHAALRARDGESSIKDAARDPGAPCFDACEGDPPWFVARGDSAGARAVVVPRAGGRLYAIVLPDPFGLSCEEMEGDVLDCSADETWTNRGVLHFAGKQRSASREHFFDRENEGADEDCRVVQWNDVVDHVDLFFAGEPPRLVARIDRESEGEAPPAVRVAVVDGRVEVRGNGCTLDVPPAAP